MLDENLALNEHIRVMQNKMSKNIGIMYKTKLFFTPCALKSLYFSFIYC